MLDQKILDFYAALQLDEALLPEGVKAMNPYQQTGTEVSALLAQFYQQFYRDEAPRELILGINPGRLGAGLTGIPFTDSAALRDHCGIDTSIETRESSADFVYRWIEACGGAQAFYQRFFIGAMCPLGFVKLNARGNWVNYNYYDQADLYAAVKDFMKEQLRRQHEICGAPRRWLILGSGKNYQYACALNEELGLAQKIVPLEHPRFVMQYRRKRLTEYLEKFKAIALEPTP